MPYPPAAPTIAMLKMFAPSASTPPSANRKHCTINTVVSTTIAALGPSNAAASTPPTRCPEVPPATGKLTICAANRKPAPTPTPHGGPGGPPRHWEVTHLRRKQEGRRQP